MSFFKKIKLYLELIKQTLIKKNYKIFFSQFGEDRIINELLIKNYKSGFYVDVGCYHPKKYSNTHLLYRDKKWRGINLDIEKDKIMAFKILRPDDINICCPVSSIKKYVKINKLGNFNVASYISKINNIKKNTSLKNVMSTKSLNEIIGNTKYKNREIDLLNIDTEGHDFDVLKSINLDKYNPKIIIIESHLNDINKILSGKIYKYLIKSDYRLRSWSFFSLIFCKKKSNIITKR